MTSIGRGNNKTAIKPPEKRDTKYSQVSPVIQDCTTVPWRRSKSSPEGNGRGSGTLVCVFIPNHLQQALLCLLESSGKSLDAFK